VESPRQQQTRAWAIAAVLATLLLSIGIPPACANGWIMLTPATATHGDGMVVSHNGLAAGNSAVYQPTEQERRFGQSAAAPTNGFLENAFSLPGSTNKHGKIARVVDALGLQAIYRQPLVRNLLGRVHGSRFCLTKGCGVNLKMSVRKPGLRFEHHF